MSVSQKITQIKAEIPENVTLVAVSKYKPVSAILEAYQVGQRVFGESKIQEMTDKYSQLPSDIQWHMIGHVQRNKVKYMASYVSLIHGVDSLRLLEEINKQAKKNNRTIDCLLQVHIADEETKFGFNPTEIFQLFENEMISELTNIRIKGLMGMATFTEDVEKIRREFKYLRQNFDKLKKVVHPLLDVTTLSMGMSNDYAIAIECGSTMIRVGSNIFGNRS